MISIIVARNAADIIGVDGEIPWYLPNDLKFFKETTLGKVVIMGRKTYESIPVKFRPFAGRHTIVVTRDTEWDEDGVLVANSLIDAIDIAEDMTKYLKYKEIMIAGGGEIYEQALPYVKRMYITEVSCDFPTDTVAVRFPNVNQMVGY